jgi:ubiquinone/menaquinone biosynthesis C-methylase UbiE
MAIESLEKKYKIAACFYDLLDYPWERMYRRWRPKLLNDLNGDVLEAGVGTGRNLPYYPADIQLTAIDQSAAMLAKAKKRAGQAACPVTFYQEDVCELKHIADLKFDWVIATFLFCVLPAEYHDKALSELAKVLKPGGRLRLLEIVYSKDPSIKRRQQRLAKFAETIYGARFDRNILATLERSEYFTDIKTQYLKEDTYLLVDAVRAIT